MKPEKKRGRSWVPGALATLACLALLPPPATGAEEPAPKAAKAAKKAGKKGKKDTKECEARLEELRAAFEAEKTKEPFERTETVVKFASAPCKATVDFLSQLYAVEKNFGILAAITQALSGMGSEEAVNAIITHGVPALFEHAEAMDELTLALARPLDPKAEEWLAKHGLTPAVRAKPEAYAIVLKAISRLKTPARLNVLTTEVKQVSSPELQVAILDGLRVHPEEKHVGLALHFIRAQDSAVRVAAYDLLEATAAAKHKQLFVKALQDPFWEVRVLALDALARLKDKDLPRHALQAMSDKDRRVRATVVQVLIDAGGASSVEALIKGFAGAQGRLLDDITDGLMRLTRKNFGPIPAQWESWWAQQKGKSENYTAISVEELLKLKEEAAANQATVVGAPLYFGLRVLTDNVVFLIDTSESMLDEYIPKELAAEAKKAAEAEKGGTAVVGGAEVKKKKKKKKRVVFSRLDLAKRELLNVFKGLKEGVRFDIIGFNTEITDFATWEPQVEAPPGEAPPGEAPPGDKPPSKQVAPEKKTGDEKKELPRLDPDTREAAQGFVKSTQAGGLTNLMAAMRAAFAYDETDTIFLLSDGAPTVGTILHEEVLAEIARMNRRRKVKINVISFNPLPAEKALLQTIAEQSRGVYLEK